jgi:alkylation response protein AidB-like acyl-CoA dehydrogenase
MSNFDRESWPITDREAFRAAVRKWITANWSVSVPVREWWKRLADAGLTVPTWSTTLGGIGATTAIQAIIEEELARITTIAPPLSGIGVHLVGPALRQYGSQSQRDRYLRPIIDGTANWCVLFHEPDARDDLGAITSSAVLDGARWSVDAVKLSVDADLADRGVLLARTVADSDGHDGLTCFAISLDQPTISVQRLSGGGSVVVCRDAIVAADDVIGEPGNGWQVAQTVLAHQQTSLAGRIRRGLVDVLAGEQAGNLDRTTGDVVTRTTPKPSPSSERRKRP